MAASSANTQALESFLREQGGFLHPGVSIAASEAAGYHWRAQNGAVHPGDTIISVPHSTALSYLNALVDEQWPIFKRCRSLLRPDFEVEAISFFYLIVQYCHRETSFWKPYLDALPAPGMYHTQPLFFDDSEDISWLAGTDVWHTNEKRTARYREIYEDGKAVLQKAGEDVSWCTWDLFRWAAITFTSRSFSSRSIRPAESKYWAACRHGKDGRSQTVLIDMSHASAFDFPVLFPGLDIGNHSNEAKIDYMFDPGRFQIKTNTATPIGEEVFNNYGPKGNDELFLGYGFCIPGNLYSAVSLTLKAPPESLQVNLKQVHPGYFGSQGQEGQTEWDTERATFQILKPSNLARAAEVFEHLPEPLLELLLYVLRHERSTPFGFVEHPREYLASSSGRRYLPHIANVLMQSLIAKLDKIPSEGFSDPTNARQEQAAVYRDEQRHILRTLLIRLQNYLKSLVATDNAEISQRPCIVTLESFVSFCERTHSLPAGFMDGIEANSNTRDIEQLRLAGWEDDIWILLLAGLSLTKSAEPHFGTVLGYMTLTDAETNELASDPDHPSHSLLELVHTAAGTCPDSIWSSPEWSLELLTQHAKRLQFDGLTVPVSDGDGGEEPRFCVYFDHSEKGSGL